MGEEISTLHKSDALLVVDVQNDFCPGGALAVPDGDRIVPELNRWIELAVERGVPVFASRDWHPKNHISFRDRGGPWPPHCIQGTRGAEFHPDLSLPANVTIISKATNPDKESYSAFGDTDLADRLRDLQKERLWIGGLALDFCVKETAVQARRLGYEVHLIANATRAVNVQRDDGARALKMMEDMGVFIERQELRDKAA
jgi:nicotinamidase/pyrazinamidase